MHAGPTQQYPTLHGKRVVVCEDDAVTQMQLARVLAQAGLVKVGAARSGEEAVAVILRERPDIVLMDAGLQGMDGWEASRAVLDVYTPCIIMLTGQTVDSYAKHAAHLALSGYVSKPVIGADLLANITEACSTDSRAIV